MSASSGDIWLAPSVKWLANRPFRGSWRILAFAAKYSRRLQNWPCEISSETTLTVDLMDSGSCPMLAAHGIPHEVGLRKVLERFLKPEGCFWDVGANFGYYAGLFSEPAYQQRRILAFEPNPKLVQRLTHALGGRSQVEVVPCALGAADGHADLSVPNAGSGLGSLRTMAGDAVKVRVRSVDSLLQEGRPAPDVMKIDVEGWEAAVLDGFSRKSELKPVIHFEHIEWAANEAGSSFARMKTILDGWRLYRVEDDGGLRATGLDKPRTMNDLIAVHPDSEGAAIAEALVRDYR